MQLACLGVEIGTGNGDVVTYPTIMGCEAGSGNGIRALGRLPETLAKFAWKPGTGPEQRRAIAAGPKTW